jgi:curved DNA-binding protein CbpA
MSSTSPPQEILGVPHGATLREIKQAYRKASLKTHPDVKGGSKEAFTQVNDAYNTLVNSNHSSHANPHSQQTRYHDATYQGNRTTNQFGSRSNSSTFHTPNPFRHRTASAVKGTMQTAGTYHFDERVMAPFKGKRLREQVLKQSQARHTRLNMWVCTVPLIAAYAAYEYNLQRRHSVKMNEYATARKKKKR